MCEEHPIPKEIDGFQIIEILGEGGMSVVYTAMQEHPRRKVAIKVLRGGQFSPSAAKRFYQEVEILGKLDHPWIAKIYNAGTHDDGTGATPYYVMEHIEDAREPTGGSCINICPSLPTVTILRFATPMAHGLLTP